MKFSAKKFSILVLVILLFSITSCPQNAGQNTDTKPQKKSDYAGNHYVNGTLVPDEIYEEYYTKTYDGINYIFNHINPGTEFEKKSYCPQFKLGGQVHEDLLHSGEKITFEYKYDDGVNGEYLVKPYELGAYSGSPYYTLVYTGTKDNFLDITTLKTAFAKGSNIDIICTDSRVNFNKNYKLSDWQDYKNTYSNF